MFFKLNENIQKDLRSVLQSSSEVKALLCVWDLQNRLYFISSIAMYCIATYHCYVLLSSQQFTMDLYLLCLSYLCMIFHVHIFCQGFLAQTWYNDVQCTGQSLLFLWYSTSISLDRWFNWNLTTDIGLKKRPSHLSKKNLRQKDT